MTHYYIINDASGMFWSNEFGWTDLENADRFSLDDRMQLQLPIHGSWLNEAMLSDPPNPQRAVHDNEDNWWDEN